MSQQLDHLSDPFQRASAAAADAAAALCRCAAALWDCLKTVASQYDGDVEAFINELPSRLALKEAPPRIRHLAQHSKKGRTRKKNINRALRDYRKETTRK